MKRHSTKTFPAANRCPRREGNTPQNPSPAAEKKRAAPHQEIPTIVENVENLEFIRTTLWKNAETHVFQALKTAHRQAPDQVIKHLHSFQHAPEQAFYQSL